MKPILNLYDPNPGWVRRALAGIYRTAVSIRLAWFRLGLIKPHFLPVHVISVGNLTVGGTGKTPTVELIARTLLDRGLKVAVLSRGYHSQGPGPLNIVSDGRQVLLEADQAGDEAYLLARGLRGVPVLTGRDRVALGRLAIERFGAEVLVLDDGYQHLRLGRDVNLLLLDAAEPWGNGFVLPAGALREPKVQAGRATAFVLTRAEDDSSKTVAELSRDFPNRPVFHARHCPIRLRSLDGAGTHEPSYLAGRRVLAFCGLARPSSFLATLTALKAQVEAFLAWPDHYRPRTADLSRLEAKAVETEVTEIVTTAKDAVKLASGNISSRLTVWILDIAVDFLGKEEEFFRLISPMGGRIN